MATTTSFLPAPTFLSFESEGLKAGDVITVVYETSFNFAAYLTAFLILNGEVCLSSTQLIKSPNLFSWNYIYETKARLINDVVPGTECYLMILDNIYRICGYYHIGNLRGKLNFSFFF